MADLSFDATDVEPGKPGKPVIPAGKYLAHAVASDMEKTKDQQGEYLWLDWEIIQSPHQEFVGAHIEDRLNLFNRNDKTVEIAQRALSAICHAVKVLKISKSDQLHFKPVCITIAVKPAEGNYGPKSEIKGYEPAEAYTGAKPAAATATSYERPAANSQQEQRPASGGGGSKPWNRA